MIWLSKQSTNKYLFLVEKDKSDSLSFCYETAVNIFLTKLKLFVQSQFCLFRFAGIEASPPRLPPRFPGMRQDPKETTTMNAEVSPMEEKQTKAVIASPPSSTYYAYNRTHWNMTLRKEVGRINIICKSLACYCYDFAVFHTGGKDGKPVSDEFDIRADSPGYFQQDLHSHESKRTTENEGFIW